MSEAIRVFDSIGHQAFTIYGGECTCGDPRKCHDSLGHELVEQIGKWVGLHGEALTLFRVGGTGGDVVRLVELDREDSYHWRILQPVFGDKWWEVVASRFDREGKPILSPDEYRRMDQYTTPEQIMQVRGAKAALENFYQRLGGGA